MLNAEEQREFVRYIKDSEIILCPELANIECQAVRNINAVHPREDDFDLNIDLDNEDTGEQALLEYVLAETAMGHAVARPLPNQLRTAQEIRLFTQSRTAADAVNNFFQRHGRLIDAMTVLYGAKGFIVNSPNKFDNAGALIFFKAVQAGLLKGNTLEKILYAYGKFLHQVGVAVKPHARLIKNLCLLGLSWHLVRKSQLPEAARDAVTITKTASVNTMRGVEKLRNSLKTLSAENKDLAKGAISLGMAGVFYKLCSKLDSMQFYSHCIKL